MDEVIYKYWPQLVALIGLVVWLVRLEQEVKAVKEHSAHNGAEKDKELRALWKQRQEDLNSARIARDETNRMISELADKVDRGFAGLHTEILHIVRDQK